jgi:hypothetical protein
MAKVITFSRTFPAYHPKVGQPTYFVEKFYNSLFSRNNLMDYPKGLEINESILEMKNHTIRAGERWKKGEYFSPRVWSGKPYNTPQIILAKDTLITDVYDFEIKQAYMELPLDYDTDVIINHRFFHTDSDIMKVVDKNDGLTLAELLQWFKYPKPFKGQIICWNKNAQY